MSKTIDEKTLEHLAELARIKIDKKEETKLLKDVRGILAYFEELEDLNTENVKPLDGGTENENIFNPDDEVIRRSDFDKKRLLDEFPEREGDFLKIPPVFE